MNENAIVALVSSFIGGFVMTWLRGFSWFGEKVTYAVAILGGLAVTAILADQSSTPFGWVQWAFGLMAYTLAVLGAVKAGGDGARARDEHTDIPAAVLPKFSELSK